MEPQLGICSARTHTIGFPQQSVYTNGETITWDSQTGSFYVDPVGCYLKFSVVPVYASSESKKAVGFGSGSACNLFSRIVVRTRSGKELTRVENLNLLAKFKQIYTHPTTWINTIGRAQGFSDPTIVTPTQSCDTVPEGGKTFIIPLCAIIPFFNTVSAKMLMPQIMEGLRIEISLESPSLAFCAVDQTDAAPSVVASYNIIRPEIHWDCYTLADQFARRLAEIAATKGLNLLHREYFHTSVSSNNTDFNFDIKKAASKALSAHVICRDQSNLSGAAVPRVDGFGSSKYDYTYVQSQIGSLYNPNQPLITGVDVNSNMEGYYFALYGANSYSYDNISCITPENFTGQGYAIDADRTDYNNTMLNFNLNKSNIENNITGTVVNNSRALLINLKRTQSTDVRIDAYLCHVRAVKVFTSNAVVLD